MNGKSISKENDRERMSPAESILNWKLIEVHPGADFVKGIMYPQAKYGLRPLYVKVAKLCTKCLSL